MARSFAIPDIKDHKGRLVHGAKIRARRCDTHAWLDEEVTTDAYGNATFTTLPDDVDVALHATWGGTTTGLKDRWFYSHINAVSEGGTGASDAATAKINLGLGTGDSPQFTAINLGHATDTTITRVSAALIAVEGDNLIRASDVDDTPVNGQTAVPASSNWAYDHVDAADPHTGYVKESVFTQDSGILVGTGSGALTEETGATLRTSIGTYSTAETDSAIDTDVATHADIDAVADDTTKGHATFEADDFDDSSGKIDLATSVCKVVAGDSGTATPSTHQVTVAGTAPISTAGASATVTVSLDADGIDKTHLSQDFGASAGRLSNYIATPINGKIINYPNQATSMIEGSVFSAVINGNPTSTSIPYDGDLKEGMLAGMSAYSETNFWGQIVLHNTTKGESVKIESVNTATNIITVTASSPDDSDSWDDEDVITCQSQTNTQAGYFDIDMDAHVTSTMTAINLFFLVGDSEGNYDGARYIMLHPYEAFDLGKRFFTFATNANEINGLTVTMPVIGQKLTAFYGAGCGGVSFVLSVLGHYEYADT